MTVIAADTETHLIEPGLLAPPLVCLQWQQEGFAPVLVHRAHAREHVRWMLEGDDTLVFHNGAYDMAVICAQWPDLVPLVFAKYRRNQVTDTMLRDQLLNIARGEFRSFTNSDGELVGVQYHLADLVRRHLGRNLKKEGFRLFYRAFDNTPNIADWDRVAAEFQAQCRAGNWPEWAAGIDEAGRAGLLAARPEEAREYALADASTTLEVYQAQERACLNTPWGPAVLVDQFRQARAAFALHLSSAWGLYTDPEAVDKLEGDLRLEFDALQGELMAEGLIRENGTANVAAARAAMVAACAEDGVPLPATKGGAVSLSSEACDRFDESSVIGQYSKYLTVRKTLSNDVKMLRAGCDVPIQPRYDIADTGRTRASKPNIQAINRGAGIREAFRPRPGKVFIQADFEGLELHTLAQWCLTVLGKSELAKALNAKKDVHTLMACAMLGIPYEEGMARKKAGDKEIKEYRQRAKPINFGYPGGLGIKKFVRFARAQYGVNLTEAEAGEAKATWLRMWPEMVDFFAHAARATANPSGLAEETHIFSGRVRGGCRYSALCNGRFQGLGADAAKAAMWAVADAQYTQVASPLYGTRTVAFVHDEVIAEADDVLEVYSPAAKELGRVMCEAANVFLPDVPVRTEPLAMRVWSKSAEPIYNDKGDLIPWAPTPTATT